MNDGHSASGGWATAPARGPSHRPGAMGWGPRPWLLAALLALGVVALGCQGQGPGAPQQVRGLLINVQASSITQTTGLTVRTDDGRELTFRVDKSVDMTPGHLREHMTLALPVIVSYVQTPGGLLAVRIDDA